MTAERGRARPGAATRAEEAVLDSRGLAELAAARTALTRAVAGGIRGDIERALAAYVRATTGAQFSKMTITSLVHASVSAGLPPARGARERESRATVLRYWTARGTALVPDVRLQPRTTPFVGGRHTRRRHS